MQRTSKNEYASIVDLSRRIRAHLQNHEDQGTEDLSKWLYLKRLKIIIQWKISIFYLIEVNTLKISHQNVTILEWKYPAKFVHISLIKSGSAVMIAGKVPLKTETVFSLPLIFENSNGQFLLWILFRCPNAFERSPNLNPVFCSLRPARNNRIESSNMKNIQIEVNIVKINSSKNIIFENENKMMINS